MNRPKQDLVQVNIRLRKSDVDKAKAIAERDQRSYHAILREAVAKAMSEQPAPRVLT